MFIKAGATRIVICTPRHAIKIARFPVITAIRGAVVSFYRKLRSGTPWQLNKKRATKHLATIRNQIFVSGIRANRAEAGYWFRTKDRDCIPVRAVLLGGLIVVQLRGETVTKSEVLMSNQAWRMYADYEFSRACQFGRWNGQVVLLDYASLGDPTLGAKAPDRSS